MQQFNHRRKNHVYQNHKNGLRKDCKQKFEYGGGNENTLLEIALAKRCLELYEKLGQTNDDRNTFFEALYGIYNRCEHAAGERLKNKRIKTLEGQSKADFKHAVELNHQIQEIK